jgi:hypothetical protein
LLSRPEGCAAAEAEAPSAPADLTAVVDGCTCCSAGFSG